MEVLQSDALTQELQVPLTEGQINVFVCEILHAPS